MKLNKSLYFKKDCWNVLDSKSSDSSNLRSFTPSLKNKNNNLLGLDNLVNDDLKLPIVSIILSTNELSDWNIGKNLNIPPAV